MFKKRIPHDPQARLEYYRNRHIKAVSNLERAELRSVQARQNAQKWSRRLEPLQQKMNKLLRPAAIGETAVASFVGVGAVEAFAQGSESEGFTRAVAAGVLAYLAHDSYNDYRQSKHPSETTTPKPEDEILHVPNEWLDNQEDL